MTGANLGPQFADVVFWRRRAPRHTALAPRVGRPVAAMPGAVADTDGVYALLFPSEREGAVPAAKPPADRRQLYDALANAPSRPRAPMSAWAAPPGARAPARECKASSLASASGLMGPTIAATRAESAGPSTLRTSAARPPLHSGETSAPKPRPLASAPSALGESFDDFLTAAARHEQETLIAQKNAALAEARVKERNDAARRRARDERLRREEEEARLSERRELNAAHRAQIKQLARERAHARAQQQKESDDAEARARACAARARETRGGGGGGGGGCSRAREGGVQTDVRDGGGGGKVWR